MENTQEQIKTKTVERKLEDGHKVVFKKTPKGNKLFVYFPDGNPWSVINIREDYTLREFHNYCHSIAKILKTKVFPLSEPAQSIHPDIITS